ncbi:hypothetical protein SCLCIDRAFT_1213064, partial [Scleroderma citrinum Foug A]
MPSEVRELVVNESQWTESMPACRSVSCFDREMGKKSMYMTTASRFMRVKLRSTWGHDQKYMSHYSNRKGVRM